MIKVSNLSYFFGRFQALYDVNFTVPPRAVAGFIGPNGAGKSTTLKLLTGSLKPTCGELWVDGVSLTQEPLAARQKLGYMPESPLLYREMTVMEYLNHIAILKGIPKNRRNAVVEKVIENCRLNPVVSRLIGALSKGNRQRVTFSQALIGDPSVILLDEPTSSMDPAQAAEMRKLILDQRRHATILLATHLLSEVRKICDYLICIVGGRVRFEGVTEDVGLSNQQGIIPILLRFDGLKEQWVRSIEGLPSVSEVKPHLMKDEILVMTASQGVFFPALFDFLSREKATLREILTYETQMEAFFQNGEG